MQDTDNKITEGVGAATGAGMKLDESGTAGISDKARSTIEHSKQVLSQKEPDPSHTEDVKEGSFGPLRYWVNTRLRQKGETRIVFAGENCLVTELTSDGKLRLQRTDESAANVPLDERYIPGLFSQLI